jgi:CRP-like cAMP-binding protein
LCDQSSHGQKIEKAKATTMDEPAQETIDDELLFQLRQALLKPQASRSHDDLLLLKSYIGRTEIITKDLDGIANPRQVNDICRSLELESYQTGEVVFAQGDSADQVYIVLRGKCDVRVRYKIDLTQGQSEIREKYIITYSSGQFFGERALQFDEPRSATVTALEPTYLITLSKSVYLDVLHEAKRDVPLNIKTEQFGTKDGVIKILSKARQKRTPQELDAVAAYLFRRIPFFQKFSMQQLVELCRVAETLTIWGKSILFKQGEIGQAFYVILTGTVEVWVADAKDDSSVITTSTAASSSGGTTKRSDLTEGLGAKVNQLVVGDVFGERALENESSQRMVMVECWTGELHIGRNMLCVFRLPLLQETTRLTCW